MKRSNKQDTRELIKKASRIKAIFTDVDGVLTDGKIIYHADGTESKEFQVKDGAIVKMLRKAGIVAGIISGRESQAVSKRASELQLDFCHQGILNKADAFARLLKHYGLKNKQVAFIGDDLPDLEVLAEAGLSVCPADATTTVRSQVDWVTRCRGGEGVFREVADLVLGARAGNRKK